MDKEQKELELLGFFGIWRESFKIISTWSKIILRLALALTLPLSFVYLAHIEINHLLSQNISRTLNTLATTTGNTTTYSLDYETSSVVLVKEMARYALFQVAYIIFHLIFSLLPAGVVYAVTCTYLGKNATFKDVVCVVPKVWKRLMVNFMCVMAIKIVYETVFGTIFFLVFLAYPADSHNYIGKYVLPGILSVGIWYMDLVWQLAFTVSVLEESYGFQALRKSKNLMKGKMGISFAIFLVSNGSFSGILWLFSRLVATDRSSFVRLGFGSLLLGVVILLGVVVKTVFYLQCKSHHDERIDKFAVIDHFEVHHGEDHLPLLKSKDGELMGTV